MVVVFVMNRELAQLLAIKFSSAPRTNPGKHFERLLSIGLLQLTVDAVCHVSLEVEDCTFLRYCSEYCRLTRSPRNYGRPRFDRSPESGQLLDELGAGPTENPDGWFDPS